MSGTSVFNSRLSFSTGYSSAPIFLPFKEFELYWGAVFFTTRSGVLVLRLEEKYWFLKKKVYVIFVLIAVMRNLTVVVF